MATDCRRIVDRFFWTAMPRRTNGIFLSCPIQPRNLPGGKVGFWRKGRSLEELDRREQGRETRANRNAGSGGSEIVPRAKREPTFSRDVIELTKPRIVTRFWSRRSRGLAICDRWPARVGIVVVAMGRAG